MKYACSMTKANCMLQNSHNFKMYLSYTQQKVIALILEIKRCASNKDSKDTW